MRIAALQAVPTVSARGKVRRGRRFLSMLSMLALSTGLVACGDDGDADSAAAEKVELSIVWWGGPERADLTNKALDLYTQKHPNVTFARQPNEWKGYYAKLESMVAGGGGLDVFQIDDSALTEYASRDITLDLSTYVTSSAIDERRFPASLAQYGELDGKPYAVPSAENTPAMIYDRTFVKQYGVAEPQIGWTYDQLIAWAGEITAKSGGTVAGTMDPSADYKALWLWLRTQDKKLYDGNQLGLDAEDLQRWFELWAGARQLKATASVEAIHLANSGGPTEQLVVTKQAAASFMWSNQLAELQKGTDHELGITAYPGDPKGQWARAAMYWSIYKSSKHPDVAADVINFLVNDAEAGKILGTERGLPANLDIRDQIATSLSPAMQATVKFENEMAERFGPAPAPPPAGNSEFRTLLVKAAENVMYGRATSAEAAALLVAQAQQALSG
ncbi:MAG: extracellular solute-binding protein [Dactylosporangium sp.]|nr:extracellular solute-binding protein [Dactylosporangium sp.]NNJ63374.1 extracellular solute-binding protein [Dactylosporangium sp.]